MMKLLIKGHTFHYALESLLRVFFPNEKIEKIYNSGEISNNCIYSELNGKHITVRFISGDFDKTISSDAQHKSDDFKKDCELAMSQMLYKLLTEKTGYFPKWGIQTGVRPSKLFFKLENQYGSRDAAKKFMTDELYISPEKVALTEEVCKNETMIIESSSDKDISLYISVPFCPTRCFYCSFISHSYESVKNLIPQYVDLLCKEIMEIGKITAENGLNLRTVYIGGGTPSILKCEEIEKIIKTIQISFNLSNLSEFTFEAGRPDTLDEDKLRFIHNSGVTRITINAQSFNDEVLKNIGRNHSKNDIYRAYSAAHSVDIYNINTDLIAGLIGESYPSFCNSVDEAILLGAANITVHTLALKRSSFLVTREHRQFQPEGQTVSMLEYAEKALNKAGYIPYYMYRQSKSVGNLENTGWCKPGYECEYNIFMMEEIHTIFGAGAGAVTRLKSPVSSKIERVFNYKYPYEYISGFDEMITRKDKIQQFIQSNY